MNVGAAVDARLICLAILVVSAGYVFVLRRRCGSWSNPSVVFGIFWSLMTFLPIIGVPQLQPSPAAVSFIFAAILSFGLPVFLFRWQPALAAVRQRHSTSAAFLSSGRAVALFAVLQIIPLAAIVLNIRFQGFSVYTLFTDPFSLGCEYLGYRYSGQAKPFFIAQIGTIINYFTAAVAGLIVASRRGGLMSALIVLLCLLPSILCIAVYADKGTIFLTLAFFYGAVVVGRITNGDTALINWRTVVAAPPVVMLVALAIAFGMINRTSKNCENRTTEIAKNVGANLLKYSMSVGYSVYSNIQKLGAGAVGRGDGGNQNKKSQNAAEQNQDPGGAGRNFAGGEGGGNQSKNNQNAADQNQDPEGAGITFYARSYAFGHLFAFSDWFDAWTAKRLGISGPRTEAEKSQGAPAAEGRYIYTDPKRLTYGFWTFMTVGKMIDKTYYASLPAGYYDELFLRNGVLQTNIYTFFRGMIYDFSTFGALGFLFAMGAGLNFLYQRMLYSAYAPISQGIYIFFAGYLYTSYIISLTIWASVYASTVLTIAFMWVLSKLEARRTAGTSVTRAVMPDGQGAGR